MICQYCGEKIDDSALFCPYCGNKISDASKKTSKKLKNKKKRPKKWKWILLLLFICCIISVMFLILWKDGFLGKSNQNEDTAYDADNIGKVYFYQTEEEHIATDSDGIMYADNEILIVAEQSVKYDDIEKIAKSFGADIVGWIEQTGDYQFRLDRAYTREELNDVIVRLRDEDKIADAYLNYFFNTSDQVEETQSEENDAFIYGEEWKEDLEDFIDAEGTSWGIEAIETFNAWDILKENQSRVHPVRVGLIDGGFDQNHEDLGFAEVFYNVSDETSDQEHGTRVAGTMAARSDNQEGICGVYPYGADNLYGVSYKGGCSYPENGSLRTSSVFLKIAYAELILRNVKVINSSLGFHYKANGISYTGSKWEEQVSFLESNSYILADFLERLLEKGYDYVLVNSAGNDSDRYNNIIYDSKYNWWTTVIDEEEYPDVYDRIIVVGAVDSEFEISNFSNGGDRVDIYAPGEIIFSTVPDNGYENSFVDENGDTRNWSGTSMASPHVSGVAAMVWSINQSLSGKEVKELVCRYENERCTECKFVDAARSVKAAAEIEIDSDVQLEEQAGILGWVVNADDENVGVENAVVSAVNTATGETESVSTDTRGHFELILPEGEYTLAVQAEGYEAYTWPGENTKYAVQITVEKGSVNYLSDKIYLNQEGYDARAAEGIWQIDDERTMEENGQSMKQIFGSAYTQYGSGMTINADGTFSYYIGAGIGGEGTWNMNNGQLTYDILTYEENINETRDILIVENGDSIMLQTEVYEYTIFWKKTEDIANKESIFDSMPSVFIFSSGAGAWSTELTFESDGSFKGYYYDSELGDSGSGYEGGTVYICNFSGKFTEPEQVNDYTYSMRLDSLQIEGVSGDVYYEDDQRFIYADPYGFDNADEFLIYVPGTPVDELPEGFKVWLQAFFNPDEEETLPYYGIYNAGGEEGFVGYE